MRFVGGLRDGDIKMLAGMVEHVGDEPGLKGRLLNVIHSAHDRQRVDRLEPVIRGLTDDEILWLCENPEAVRKPLR